MRVRFSLAILSVSLLALSMLTEQLLPLIINQFEYSLNINTDNLLFSCLYVVVAFTLWFVAIKQKLHLSWVKATTHAFIICLPILISTFSDAAIDSLTTNEYYVEGRFNGQLEPYNWHFTKTQSVDSYFLKAKQRFNNH